MGRKKDTGITYHNGYRFIHSPEHPNAGANNYMAEHRLVVERKLGRYLNREEHIHHINGDKLDNRAENLQVVSQAEHRAIHNVLDKKNVYTFDTAEAERLYNLGFSARSVAAKLNVGKSTIASYIKKVGISRPNISDRCDKGLFIKREAI